MNKELLRKLQLQAGGSHYPDINPQMQELFAKLIVQECANQCDLLLNHKMSSEWARGTHDCSRAIKQHFGVEE